MTVAPIAWQERTEDIGGRPISLRVDGTGPALLVLPRDFGHPPRWECLEYLARTSTVYLPAFPGFHGGFEEEWDWLSNPRDLAVVMLQLVETLGLGAFDLLGLGFGGWVAAEMATMRPDCLSRIALVSPMGIQPKDGFIFDQFLVSTEAYVRRAFLDEAKFDALYAPEPEYTQLDAWETDRMMTSRLCWKPYMYNPVLPGLLQAVANPAVVLMGEGDAILPADCGEQYARAMGSAKLITISGAGHAVELEQPRAVADAVLAHIGRASKVTGG